MDERRIYRHARRLLISTVDGIEEQDYPTPEKQFVAAGSPVFDGPIIAAAFESMVPIEGDLSTETRAPIRNLHQRAGQFSVYYVVNAEAFANSVGGEVILPAADALDREADDVYGAALAGVNAVVADARAEKFGAGNQVLWVGLDAIDPAGGVTGWVCRWHVDLVGEPTGVE